QGAEKLSCRLLKKIQREARTNRDRVGQRGRAIHEHEHANMNTNSSETIERTLRQCSGQSAYGSFSAV
ncbi:MAG TPA: hypothetical protein VK632_09555, partial [Verrucomicrobiae bacterium]|nr:hypothetical protein [Verrucomicrobiae bacterium]